MDVNFTEEDLATVFQMIQTLEKHLSNTRAVGGLIGRAEMVWEKIRREVEGEA